MNLPSSLPTACLIAGVLAIPAGFQWGQDSPTWTEAAGQKGATTAESLVPTEFFGLQALKLTDFDGRACEMQLEQSSFNAPSSRPLDPVRFCEPKQAQSWKRADMGSGHFVTGIAVCTAKAGGPQVHGVELWGASLEPSGKLKPAKAPVRLELSGCEKWSTRRLCPASAVATGVRAHLGEAGIGAVGLSLRCQTLKSVN